MANVFYALFTFSAFEGIREDYSVFWKIFYRLFTKAEFGVDNLKIFSQIPSTIV
jgi:hypothetical protein